MKKFNKVIALMLALVSVYTAIPTSVYANSINKNNRDQIEIKVDENGNPTQETIN